MTGPELYGVAELLAVMDRLRSPGGCPWDAAQTHASLAEYALEEVHELLEAIDADDRAGLREELGDLLLQVVFHTRIATEHTLDPFDIDDVARDISAKLRLRHPHVFAVTSSALTADDVEASWTRAKMVEKGRESVTDGIPASLPALALAAKTVSRVQRGGAGVLPEPAPLEPGVAVHIGFSAEDSVDEDNLGELLLGIVVQARAHGLDAETALRKAVARYRSQVRAAEGLST